MSDQYPPPPYGQPPYGPPPYPPGSYPPPAPAPPYGAAPSPFQQPPLKKANKGCTVAVVAVVLIFVAIMVAIPLGIAWLGRKAEEAIGSFQPCPYITDEEATEAVGTDAEADLWTGGLGRILNITDARVLPDKESCIIQETGRSGQEGVPGLGRAVRYVGADAELLFDLELTKAKGVEEDRGGGITVQSTPYFNKDVPGLGDRAFCTKSSGLLAGVLVLDGDKLVYVAVTRADVGLGADLSDPGNGKLTTDDPACESSVALARRILARG